MKTFYFSESAEKARLSPFRRRASDRRARAMLANIDETRVGSKPAPVPLAGGAPGRPSRRVSVMGCLSRSRPINSARTLKMPGMRRP